MSNLNVVDTSALVVSSENLKVLDEHPLLAVPQDLRRQVFAAWSMFRHLPGMDTPSPIAFPVGMWIGEFGISKEVIRKALRDLTSPDVMRKIRFASDLTATLAEMVTPVEERVYDVI